MNFTPAPTIISTVVSLFRKPTPQPTFTPAAPPVPTQVYITRSTTTHVDPPVVSADSTANRPPALNKNRKDRPLSLHVVADIFEKKQQQHHLFPDTPCAPNPHRTTFVLPILDWSATKSVGGRCYGDDGLSSFCEVNLDDTHGHAHVCHATERGVYAVVEPKTVARALFFLGFVFPVFWIAGSVIMWIPLRTTRDWEAGRSSMEVKWECSVIRETELRWARRCLVALVSEILIIVLIVVIVKWGVQAGSNIPPTEDTHIP